jgi:tetratricopeptide (TPR) repeat protein/transcriptional regulator with XRE-family HTH domain
MAGDRGAEPGSRPPRPAGTEPGDGSAALGDRLRAYRRSAGISQQELAERSGLTVRMISNLESGRTRWPFPNSLRRLADALRLSEPARAQFVSAARRRPVAAPSIPGQTTGQATGRPAGRAADQASGRAAAQDGAGGPVVPRQLPALSPAFAGRQAQLAALSEVMNEPDGTAAVVTISGAAGVGKTALAVYWAHQAAGRFPDGQLFADLCGFGPAPGPARPATIVRVFLNALGIPADQMPVAEEAQFGLYRSLLADRRILVVLDNAHDATQVRPLLPGWPSCRAIVTSRNQLTGLTAIDAARPLTLDVLTDAEARHLLGHRLGPARVAAEPAAVTHLLRSGACLPLALGIIAARAATRPDLTLAEVAADLDAHPGLDAFADDSDPAADVRAAFSWSYRQLPDGAARAFRRAALHPGADVDRYAVAALTGTAPDQAGPLLDTLTRGGMLQSAGPDRYRMHDLLRGYGLELTAGPEGQDERRAALTGLFHYYLHTAVTAVSAAFPADRDRLPAVPSAPGPAITSEAAALAWLDAERPSLVAVARHMTGHGWPAQAIQLSAALFRYLETGGHYPEALVIHGHAGQAARHLGDRAAEANASNYLGVMDMRQGRWDRAHAHFGRALPPYRAAGDRAGQARVLANLGLVGIVLGRDEAAGQLHRALGLFRELGDRSGEARALASVGFLHLRQGRYADAADDLERSAALSQGTGDKGGQGRALGNLGEVELRRGNHPVAERHLRRAIALFRELGDQISEADTLASLGLVALGQGRPGPAEAHLRQALELCRETGDLSSEAAVRNGLGEVLLATGRLTEARAEYAAALDVATTSSERYDQGRAHDGLARAHQAGDDPARARRHWQEALACYEALGVIEAGPVRARLDRAATHTGTATEP